MFGPYSFISVMDGREEKGDSERSWRNMVEVSIVMKILKNLYNGNSSWSLIFHANLEIVFNLKNEFNQALYC